MEFFEKYVSNTLGGTGNQYYFKPEDSSAVTTGRVFYKIFKGGKFNYSLLFSNIIDSTFQSGHDNLICDQWQIHSMRLGVCDACDCKEMAEVFDLTPVTFNGSPTKTVMPGEFFCTDEVLLDIKKGQFLCVEIAFSGNMLPCHPESILPTFVCENGQWIPSKNLPVPNMVGCDRQVKRRITFLGDSITQGIGTVPNSYTHWNALIADMLGEDNAYWNIGLGCGRADDAATDGAWLFKAKQSDVVFLCYGVNDIRQGFTDGQIAENLERIVNILTENGIKVIIQTVPPFDYIEIHRIKWEKVNAFIQNVLSKKAVVFDCVPILGDEEKGLHYAKHGGHPNAKGCELWAKGLYDHLVKVGF